MGNFPPYLYNTAGVAIQLILIQISVTYKPTHNQCSNVPRSPVVVCLISMQCSSMWFVFFWSC
ncbi:hypothetical protein EV424DRAFT_1425293 [Suillus variegatus]|nr:hypothetical protein EV424DRAFT_1425293 [Suillus variegatus]